MVERYCALLSALTLFMWTLSSPPSLSLWVLKQLLIPVSLPFWQGAFPLPGFGQATLLKPDSEPADDAKPAISYCLEALTIRQGVYV